MAGLLAGAWHRPAWNEVARPLEFFDGKGVVEELARDLGLKRLKLRAAELPHLQPGRSAEVVLGGTDIGWLGEVHPAVSPRSRRKRPCRVRARPGRADPGAQGHEALHRRAALPRRRVRRRALVPEEVSARAGRAGHDLSGGKLLESVRLFDVYRGQGVDRVRSPRVRARVPRPDRTLTAEEVDGVHERVVRKASAAVGGELRG